MPGGPPLCHWELHLLRANGVWRQPRELLHLQSTVLSSLVPSCLAYWTRPVPCATPVAPSISTAISTGAVASTLAPPTCVAAAPF